MKRTANRLLFLFTATIISVCTISAHADTYTYDPLNRLTRVAYDDLSAIDYIYDAAGNITQIIKTGTPIIPVAGVCGGSNGGTFDAAPTTNLCNFGTPSATGVWNWICNGLYGGTNSLPCSALPSLSINIAGSGTVNSDSNFSCSSSNCRKGFIYGSVINMYAVDNATSTFSIWSGDCIGSSCQVTMTAPHTVTATFTLAPKAKIGIVGYSSLALAYSNVAINGSATIKLLGVDLAETLTVNNGKNITLLGGYDAAFAIKGATPTLLKGPLLINSGSLRVDGVKVK